MRQWPRRNGHPGVKLDSNGATRAIDLHGLSNSHVDCVDLHGIQETCPGCEYLHGSLNVLASLATCLWARISDDNFVRVAVSCDAKDCV